MKAIFLTITFLFLSSFILAANVFVPDDYGTLQGAIGAVSANDTIFVRPGTYSDWDNVDLVFSDDNISMISTDGPDVTILDGSFADMDIRQAFNFDGTGNGAYVEGFTITGFGGALEGGAVFCQGVTASFNNCRFIENFALNWGGAAHCASGGTLNFTNCYFEANQAIFYASYAGALGSWQATANATNCTFKNNSSGGYGGAIFFAHGGTPEIVDCRFESNATIHGGAFGHYAVSGSYTGCTFLRNYCSQKGGVAFIQDRCSTVVTNCTAFDNSGGIAGAFFIEERNSANGCPVKFENDIIAYNKNDQAFVVVGSAATPTISCSDVFGNPLGDWTGYMAAFAGVNGNFSGDPLFCDTAANNFNIDPISPCAPGNNECDVLIGSLSPGCEEGNIVVYPDPLYAFYAFAIEPMIGYGIVTMVDEEHGAAEIDVSTIRINGSLEPMSFANLPSESPFDMFKVEFPVTDLINTYELLWDTTRQAFAITGQYTDETPFIFERTITTIGHASGDVNADGNVNVGDVVSLINYIFHGSNETIDLRNSEVNCDGAVNIGDGVYLVKYIFSGGPAPGVCP
ncbi:MAG: dockerin type I domain-containing protein [Candidatus Zixiibacteriota bacterium]